jgi:amino acid adenylation domain-containing protein/FkbM family methyltransferase
MRLKGSNMQQEIIQGFRLSPQQKRLWSLQRPGDNQPYRAQCAVLIHGPLEIARLRSSVAQVVKQNEILRTGFCCLPGMTIPLQVIGESDQFHFTHYEWSKLTVGEKAAGVEEAWNETQQTPFSLESVEQLHVWLLTLSEVEHVMILSVPAMCADAASLRLLLAEISCGYGAASDARAALAEPSMQYADVSEWQNELLESEDREERRTYWLQHDILSLASTKLPYDGTTTVLSDATSQVITRALDSNRVGQLEALGKKYETSVSVVLLTCWHILLGRLTTQIATVIGTAVDGRKYKELETIPGLFTRYLPVICHLEEGISFKDLLLQQQATLSEAYTRQDNFTWDQLKDAATDQTAESYFSFGFDYQDQPAVHTTGDISFTISKQYICTEHFDLRLSCSHQTGILNLEFRYDSTHYSHPRISRLADELSTLINSVIEHEDVPVRELEIIGEDERQQLLVTWNDTATTYPQHSHIHELFERQAAQFPDAFAVLYEDQQLTFGELNQRANQLAHYLRSEGVGAEIRVALCLERSPEMVVALLAILKSGGVYVPLDPSYPQERLRFMLDDSGASVLLTEQGLLGLLPEHNVKFFCLDTEHQKIAKQSTLNPDSNVQKENLAYIIYTSGSTGTPKGVCVSHDNLLNSTGARFAFYRHHPGRFLLLSSIAFDSSVAGIFWMLCAGGALVLPAEGLQRDAHALVQLIERQRVSHLLSLPALHLSMLEVAGPSELNSLRVAIVAGEACTPELVRRHQAAIPETALFNEYGPTEATVWSTVYECVTSEVEGRQVVPIGRPIPNTSLYILDDAWRPVPSGVAGELYIGGPGITRGYLDHGEMTAERFIPHPFTTEAGARLYRTGDLVRYFSDGQIEFLGRSDSQVKIRGFRIEPGEIEAVLSRHEAVKEAVVITRDESSSGKRLVAYLALDSQHGRTACQLLRREAEGQLPAYELPNGLTIIRYNKNEADYLYHEIFEEQTYFAPQITLPAQACVFDVGANIGLFSLFVAHVCEGARIFAFEPMPEIFNILRANAELYGLQATLLECGLSDRAGSGNFSYYPHLSLLSGLFPDAAAAQAVVKSFEENSRRNGNATALPGDAALAELLTERLETRQVECRLRTISEVMKTEGVEQIDLLKIDVEKSELAVLQGVEVDDWQKIKQVVVELEDREGRLDEVRTLLESAGYEIAVEQDEALQKTRLYKVYAVRAEGAPQRVVHAGREWLRPAIRAAWKSPAQVLEAVWQAARNQLPDYMIPDAMVLLEELPLMANGKIDRQALPDLERFVSTSEISSPRTPTEEVLAGIWAEVLGVKKLSVTDNFFELGGHSLLATQVMSRLRKAFNIELPVRSLFGTPTVRGLAVAVDHELSEKHSLATLPLKAVERSGQLPLSYAQQRLWFLDQLQPGSVLYNLPVAVRLNGELDLVALEQTLTEIVRRHEVLRTSFPEQRGKPLQVVAEPINFNLLVTDLTGMDSDERESAAQRLAEEEAQRPFDLTRGPLLRASLLKFETEEFIALFTMHHIVSDGWSVGVLLKEIAVLYEAYSQGQSTPLPELTIQYADFAIWQRESLTGEALQRQVSYWTEQLAGVTDVLELPTDRARPLVQSFRGGHHTFSLTADLSEKLRELSRNEDVTLYMTLLASWQVLLSRYTGQEQVCVGTPIANRNLVETEMLIGFFVNTLVMRGDLSGDPDFREVLRRTREVCLGAYARQDMPFEKLVELLQPKRSLSHTPLVQVWFAFQNAPESKLELSGLSLSLLTVENSTAKFDLGLNMTDTDQGLAGTLEYKTDLFNASTARRVARQFEALLRHVVERPEERLSELANILATADQELQHEELQASRKANLEQLKLAGRSPVSATQIR